MDSLNKYLEATHDHLGVECERYGGRFRAIVAPRPATEFLFGKLEGSDFEATQAQFFLAENQLFPSAYGATPAEALKKLDTKLSLLYRFIPGSNVYRWTIDPLFDLKANYDADPGETPSSYQVAWHEVVADLQSSSGDFFYERAKEQSSLAINRNLYALVNFKYEGPFAQLERM